MTEPVLSIRNLTVEIPTRHGLFKPVRNVSYDIHPGEIRGVVGESGAGKSMTGNAVIGLLDDPAKIAEGEIWLNGRRIDNVSTAEKRAIRGKEIGMIFQDPLTSLNPLFTIGEQLVETIQLHLNVSASEAKARALALLDRVSIPNPKERFNQYPHQFSGGMRQRVVIALALCSEPSVIVADEPTTALDVSIQAQVLDLIKELAEERKVGVIFVTHDMGVIAETATRMIVMNKGRIVETGTVGDIIKRPKEEYTIGLIDSIPSIRDETRRHDVPPAATQLVKVENLTRDFDLSPSFFDRLVKGSKRSVVKAVQDVSFGIRKGSTYGLVGESGSGKSTCARMLVGLIPPTSGRVLLEDEDIWESGSGTQKRRQRVQMIFQDPYASLNPRWRVGDIIAEPMRALKLVSGKREAEERVADLLEKVRLDPIVMRKFPHEFSGGQRQRIAIARALSSQPEFIVCDEPTSALDVSVQAQVLDLMRGLQDEFGLTYLLISHNLAVVRQMADDVGVMHGGVLVEQGPVDEIFDDPKVEYTRMLLNSVPDISKVE